MYLFRSCRSDLGNMKGRVLLSLTCRPPIKAPVPVVDPSPYPVVAPARSFDLRSQAPRSCSSCKGSLANPLPSGSSPKSLPQAEFPRASLWAPLSRSSFRLAGEVPPARSDLFRLEASNSADPLARRKILSILRSPFSSRTSSMESRSVLSLCFSITPRPAMFAGRDSGLAIALTSCAASPLGLVTMSILRGIPAD